VLAQELDLPLADPVAARFDYLLVVTLVRLELRSAAAAGPVYVDFTAGAAAHRRRFGGGRKQPLARAVGLKQGHAPDVLDATAGLGADAFVLACLGCRVRLVERSPLIAVLLRDGLARAGQDSLIGGLVRERLSLTQADSREFIAGLTEAERPEVIYLDPMYPQRGKTAQVKKEMRTLRMLAGEDRDAPALLAAALTRARRRVVVKRPRWAPSLAGPAPTAAITAPNTRFDLYVITAG